MAEISKITLPSGTTYELKDEYARQLLAGGLKFVVCWDGTTVPDVTKIPSGVKVTYNGQDYTGTFAVTAAQPLTFYLVRNSSPAGSPSSYAEYAVVGETGSQYWEKLGDTSIDLSDLGALAYKDNVTLSKGNGQDVLGAGTTATAADSAVSFSGGATDTFVKGYPGATSKLVKDSVNGVAAKTDVSIPNVTSVGAASDWAFQMGTGQDAETLIISGGNGSAPTLGTALEASKVTTESKDFATGALANDGAGDSVLTGLGTATTGTAVTDLGTGTAAAQTITLGNNDQVKVAKYADLSVSVS